MNQKERIRKVLSSSNSTSYIAVLEQPEIDKVSVKIASYGSDTVLQHNYIGGNPLVENTEGRSHCGRPVETIRCALLNKKVKIESELCGNVQSHSEMDDRQLLLVN